MCSMIGVFTTGAMGLGVSPVSGKSRVPLPAASTIAFISGHSLFLAWHLYGTHIDSLHWLSAEGAQGWGIVSWPSSYYPYSPECVEEETCEIRMQLPSGL